MKSMDIECGIFCEESDEIDMKTFKVSAMGDQMYFSSTDLDDAQEQFTAMCGPLPDDLVSWTELNELPDDEKHSADFRGIH